MSKTEKIEQMFWSLEGAIGQIGSKLDAVLVESKQMKEENVKLRETIKTQDVRIEQLEREVRKKSVVIRGGGKVTILLQKIGIDTGSREQIGEAKEKANTSKVE
uniref:Uncharacterized protein n=1 Tax=Photinus pyralis TaxID=7054 RepID=A0A1Y1JU87_PHOPY